MGQKTLLVLLGPTGVGKTEAALHFAQRLGSPIVNADSRQIYRDLPVGTAAPTAEQQRQVRHYFVGTHALDAAYSAAQYENDVLELLAVLFRSLDTVVLAGGSMMYIDAVCSGIDDIPTIEPEVRATVRQRYEAEGLPRLVEELRLLDPDYAAAVDRRNTQRVLHALEVCYQTGRTFTSFRRGVRKERPFRIVKLGLCRERADLFDRINRRVDAMMAAGFLDEARRVLPFRHCNSLNTVGYKDLFRVLDGEWELPFALDRIRKNTRVYAKKQLTWFRRDASVRWLHPDDSIGMEKVLAEFGR
ncbi:MAG: tRNA (adenosine(37)-N6)-dimethylallyltransferase MiaA [Alloprevotella sp.]|nr:tRNA (adenosine(37)-N6)-dimethylallyltransferase MiaA [Alloprevotella sp.]